MAQDVDGFPIVGVGASAGGLEALREMFSNFDGAPGMAFVVVQHLDPTHESLMAQLLERYTSMSVKQAEGGEALEPDHIYVIPPGHGLALERGVLSLTEFTDPRGMRRPIDDFFESLAEDVGDHAACVILSGTGGDGSRGLRAIKEHAGVCVVQDPETAAYDGMPTSAISTGLVDMVREPGDIVSTLVSYFDRGDQVSTAIDRETDITDLIDSLCEVLRDAVGHDFSRYKRSTLNRRIARRMQVLGIDEGPEYLARLRADMGECDALFRDLLINVTRFFRDTEHFDNLREQVIDPLVSRARTGEEIRVWVPGCSSGEEAYSIAMMLAAAAKRFGNAPYFQVFATDIDDRMLDIARSATYPIAAMNDIPAPYRDEFVVGGLERFTIAPKIRDMVRFGVHNLVRDPPYSKIDLISCRNVLIYFDDSLQKLVIPLFHFALRDGGFLLLGSSETIGRHDDLFEAIDQSARIFRRKHAKGNYSLKLSADMGQSLRRRRNEEDRLDLPRSAPGSDVRALQTIAERYAPVCLLLDGEGMLLERWGSASRYLEFPDRLERSIHVPTLARPGLREVIGPLLRKVGKNRQRAGVKDIEILTDFGKLRARVVCELIDDAAFLIVIEETGSLEPHEVDFEEFDVELGQTEFLEQELRTTRERLRSTVEELETTNEELKSSNEEMMSMNEELQSTNEELTTVNDELKTKVDQLTVANSDLKNFFDSTQLPVLVVDAALNLRSFTEAATTLFPIDDHAVGKPLAALPSKVDLRTLTDIVRRAAVDGVMSETSLHIDELGAEFILRVIPYRLLDGAVDGATLVFTDVTEALSLERNLREERERLRLALEVARIGIWEYEPSTDRTVLDETERELLNIAEDDPGETLEPILASMPAEDRDRVNKALRMALEGGSDFQETFRIPLGNGEMRWLHGLGKLIDLGHSRKFIGVTFDVSAERQMLAQRELMIREMNHRVKNLFSVIAAMVTIASRETDDVKGFAESLRSRIHALGRSHALTNQIGEQEPRSVSIEDLIDTVLRPNLSEQRVDKSGDPLMIESEKITSLALILHEWATNSSKYGALAVRDGRISIAWSEDGEDIALVWSETGQAEQTGAAASPGFGTKLVETAARQLQGAATGTQVEGGYRRELRFSR
ncbi:PAS domain-containing protein [Qipengyuania sp. 6B39]|uniref:chemotaxis protein CheB n=1 Tax=Qipengyuania proteolytica TaxID=2867239 RepID=UPI001C8AB744|nr:chemotaxis protein CheB [Qipengyuania proteolytica]MBX7496602.1 PAS domain-containing protein [Qipengyuania proteolytica]